MKRGLKDLYFIHNKWQPKNFKEYQYLLEACISDIEKLTFTRKGINDQLKELRRMKKHLLDNPILKPKPEE